MTREDQLKYCKICNHKGFDLTKGVICNLTSEQAMFTDTCPDFKLNEKAAEEELAKEKHREQMALEEETAGLSEYGIKNGRTAGVVIMVASVAWLVGGVVFLNRIFFYPFFLFIAGIVVFVKAKK